MRILSILAILLGIGTAAAAVEWQDDFDGDFDQPWDFLSDDGASPPSHADATIVDDALNILGRDADFPDQNFFTAGLVGLTTNSDLAFPDAFQLTATFGPVENNAISNGNLIPSNSDVFLLARSFGASGYVLALDRETGSFDLVRSDGGNPSNIADGLVVPDFDTSGTYIMRLTGEGNRIRGEIFDDSMNLILDAYATDNEYASGFAGLGAAVSGDTADPTFLAGRFDDVLATDENIIPALPFFPTEVLDARTPTSTGLNVIEIRDEGVPQTARVAINQIINAAPANRFEGTIASLDIHDPDNGDNMGSVDSPQQPIITDMFGVDDNNFVSLTSGSFAIGEGEDGEYTFNFHSDDGFAMRLFYEDGNSDLVSVPFTKIGERGIITTEGAVSWPEDSGDSNVQAVANLEEGSYSYEMVWFEQGGGAFAEVSTDLGDHLDDPASANWVLLGDGSGLALIDGFGTGPANVMPGLPGDFDGSGGVEQADLDLVLLNWGQEIDPSAEGWVNDLPDGAVDQGELDKVLLNWGNTAGGANAESTPEPSSIVLLAIALLIGAWTRLRK